MTQSCKHCGNPSLITIIAKEIKEFNIIYQESLISPKDIPDELFLGLGNRMIFTYCHVCGHSFVPSLTCEEVYEALKKYME